MTTRALRAQVTGQAGTIAAGALHPEGRHLAEAPRPGEQLTMPGGGGWHELLPDAAAKGILSTSMQVSHRIASRCRCDR